MYFAVPPSSEGCGFDVSGALEAYWSAPCQVPACRGLALSEPQPCGEPGGGGRDYPPSALSWIGPEVASHYPRVQRVGAVVERDSNVVAGVAVDGDKDGFLDVQPRQFKRMGDSAAAQKTE